MGETLADSPQSNSVTQPLAPSGIQKAYSLPSNLNGSGQTLALFELDGFTVSDITGYESAFNLPNVPLNVVLVDGFNGQPGSGAVEVTLDIQLMVALASGVSQIIVYEGPNSGSGVIDTYNRIATDNLAKSISTSWGLPEDESSGSMIQSEGVIFKQMVAQGQAIYAASGDSGAYDDGVNLGVDDPASQPFVVGVGGTHLNLDANGNYVNETTWSYGNGPGEGGGGGISSIWSIPSWQQGVANANNLASTTMRNVPDVSLDADPYTGYYIYYGGQWGLVGGTSCAAPLWAAFTALVNQQRAINGSGTLGFPNPLLYQAGASPSYQSLFHDITIGTNGYYPAVAGYDLATGFGSYIASSLISFLANATSPVCTRANPSVVVNPASERGPAGSTLSYTATITNNDSASCGASSFALLSALPTGFSDSLAQSYVTIETGQSASFPLTVTSSNSVSNGSYSFYIVAVNTLATSYMGVASATYIVQENNVTLTIVPQNASFARNTTAVFKLTLANGTSPIANNPINLAITGPINLVGNAYTGINGLLYVELSLSDLFPLGHYEFTASTSFQGTTVVTQTGFSIY